MKWYFCIESHGLRVVSPYIKAAVASCRKNTDLTPICLYYDRYGLIDEDLADFLRQYDVELIQRTSRVYLAATQYHHVVTSHMTQGCFLRFDIPLIEKTDEYVLYTDCDVIFQNPIDLDEMRPKFFAAAPEFHMDMWGYFNSGVLLMNVEEMRRTSDDLLAATLARMRAGFGTSHDQGDLNAFYFEQWDRLPPVYNWKPYWGVNDGAKIIHFHGVKPGDFYCLVKGLKEDAVGKRLIDLNHSAYLHYVSEFLAYLQSAGLEYFVDNSGYGFCVKRNS